MIKNNEYIGDVEIFPNYFGVSFVPRNADRNLIEVYKDLDKQIIDINYKLDSNKIDFDSDLDDSLKIDKLQEGKQKLLKLIGIKQFRIWKDIHNNNYINDIELIEDFFKSHKIIWGYNNYNYDDTMLDIILYNARHVSVDGNMKGLDKHITEHMFEQSVSCIDYGKGYYRLLEFKKYYKRPFTGYDIQKILYLDKSFTALKQVAICLKWYRIQSLPKPFDEPISKEEIFDIEDYNINDDLITLALIDDQDEEIKLREKVSDKFKINARNLSRSSMGKAITAKYYAYFSNTETKDFIDKRTDRSKISLKNIISDEIHFQTKSLSDFLDYVKSQVIHVGTTDKSHKFSEEVIFDGTIYTMALGGLHSRDEPRIFSSLDGYLYRDADVRSYYPYGIIKFDVCPAHLQRVPFRATILYQTETRGKAKAKAKEYKNIDEKLSDEYLTESDGLKIAVNRAYGALRDRHDFLYDPKCTYQTTVNLQLSLLMLIEDLVISSNNNISVISANTDGIVCRFKPEYESLYQDICKRWEKKLEFELEYTDYEKYIRNDVNNYIAIKKGFNDDLNAEFEKFEIDSNNTNHILTEFAKSPTVKKLEKKYIKRKGLFIEEVEFNKGYDAPVVSLALNNYFIYNIPYEYTIENHIHSSKEAIYDYCISQKTDNKFDIEYWVIKDGEFIKDSLQKSNRFYVSNTNNGTIIKKEKGKSKTHCIRAKVSVEPFNNYIYKDDYELNLGYYKKECNKIIEGSCIKKKTLKKQTSGIENSTTSLFDTDEFRIKESKFEAIEKDNKFTKTARRFLNLKIENIEDHSKTLSELITFVGENLDMLTVDEVEKLRNLRRSIEIHLTLIDLNDVPF